MLSLFRVRGVVAFLVAGFVAACSSGGLASSCSGCGMKPLARGFPRDEAIDNAAAIRLTRSGLDVVGANLQDVAARVLGTAGVVTFDIPHVHESKTILPFVSVGIDICPDGANAGANPPQCIVELNLSKAHLRVDAIREHALSLTGTIPVRVRDLRVRTGFLGLGGFSLGLGDGSCSGSTPNFDYRDFPMQVELDLLNEPLAPRNGYTKIVVKKLAPSISRGDMRACKDCSFLTGMCNSIFTEILRLAFEPLIGGIKDQLASVLEQQLCTRPDSTLTPSCPNQTHPDNADPRHASKCMFDADRNRCLPIMLGIGGSIDLGGLLHAVSPQSTGAVDFVFAGAGNMSPDPSAAADSAGQTINGVTLGLVGGLRAGIASKCVAQVANPLPMALPMPDEFRTDRIAALPPGMHADVGLSLSSRFINYSLASMYNTGFFCLGMTSEQVPLMQSGLLGMLIPSLANLPAGHRPTAIAVTTRPQHPPTVQMGTGANLGPDALLTLQLKELAVDVYIWSYERYVRALTFSSDISVPLNLQVVKAAGPTSNTSILPVLGPATVTNAHVTNSGLLSETEPVIANAMSVVVGGMVGQLMGVIKPLDVSGVLSSLGLILRMSDNGIVRLRKNGDDFVGVFAQLVSEKAPVSAPLAHASVTLVAIDPGAIGLAVREDTLPAVRIAMSADRDDQGGPTEYAWALDNGLRSAWSKESDVTIRDRYLAMQGAHVVHVFARAAGDPLSESDDSADVSFVIDGSPPQVGVRTENDRLTIDAWDAVSSREKLEARVRVVKRDGVVGDWSRWSDVAAAENTAVDDAVSLDFEVRDEQQNVMQLSHALVRGRPDPTLPQVAGVRCSMSRAPAGAAGHFGGVMALLALGIFAARRRTLSRCGGGRAPALQSVATIILSGAIAFFTGCSAPDAVTSATDRAGPNAPRITRPTTTPAMAPTDSPAVPTVEPMRRCGTDCKQPCAEKLTPGVVGAYMSAASSSAGTLWVAGYNDLAQTSDGTLFVYGDLVAGRYDAALGRVHWAAIDGVPTLDEDHCIEHDPRGWRGGETRPGDDVGRWTSLQVGADGSPKIAYYDATHASLKYAAFNGQSWAIHTIKSARPSGGETNPGSTGDFGRYAKMILVDDKPVVAFLAMSRAADGRARTGVMVARAANASPSDTADWALEDAAFDETTACTAAFCDADAAVSGAVEAYPNAYGEFIGLAKGAAGLGIVAYDRLHGNLVALEESAGRWHTSILGGEQGSRASGTAVDTGDVGVGAALAIDAAGAWHVTYVNATTERLEYVRYANGTVGQAEVVDEGARDDGLHLIGDDSTVRVGSDGAVSIAYQDATAGALCWAVGAVDGATHRWTRGNAAVSPKRIGGYFPAFVGDKQVISFWRGADPTDHRAAGDVAVVKITSITRF